jgi:hypothetical protein
MSLDPVKNFAKVQVLTGYDSAALSINLSVGDGAKLPDPATSGAFNLVWFNSTDYSDPTDDPAKEIIRVTARAADTLTISRAQEGTSASDKNLAGKTYKMILAVTKKMIDDLEDRNVDNELVGVGDDAETHFILDFTPSPASSLHVYMQGIRQIEGLTNDYTLSGTTITFKIAPYTDAVITADYRK